MRVFKLLVLGILAYVVTVLFLFPAAPIVDRIKPMIKPVELVGVGGKILSGNVARVNYDHDLAAIELSNVTWKLAPQKLLALAAGVNFTFDAYGGSGDGSFAHRYNGDMSLTDVTFSGPAKGLEALLPLPIASFNGKLNIDIETLEIKNQLLESMRGKMVWANAVLETPIRSNLCNITLDINPVEDGKHRGTIVATDGDLDIQGNVDLTVNGDFVANITITPKSTASPELLNALRGIGRADSSGRYRIQQNGNVNRLM